MIREDNFLEDVFSRLKLKWKLNLLAIIVLFAVMAGFLGLRTLRSGQNQRKTQEKTTYATFLSYTVKDDRLVKNSQVSQNGISEYYYYLLVENTNGAYLFSDVEEEKLESVAEEMGVSAGALRNSRIDFWANMIKINALRDNVGFSVSINTASQTMNDILESRFTRLIDAYGQVFDQIRLERVEPIHSSSTGQHPAPAGASKVKLLLKFIIVLMAAVTVVLGINVFLVLYRPTLDRTASFRKYKPGFVFEVKEDSHLQALMQYQKPSEASALVVLERKLLDPVRQLAEAEKWQRSVLSADDVPALLKTEAIEVLAVRGRADKHRFERLYSLLTDTGKKLVGVYLLEKSVL
ncbi:MAG: hypothetical protein SPL15_07970 [Lachnospiraceae bacterium]|nr:hypothetical protein [Lachnospiraceae bacterium]MDY5742910.1 hypothetical protein [Lachnospiraceae bacterium]